MEHMLVNLLGSMFWTISKQFKSKKVPRDPRVTAFRADFPPAASLQLLDVKLSRDSRGLASYGDTAWVSCSW